MTEPTDTLVARLAVQLRPVSALRHPVWRAMTWLAVAAGILALLAIEHGVRPDLADQLHSGAFQTRLCASLATGVLATIGCMMASLPDRSRLWLLLPVPALGVWLSGVGYGCLTGWVSVDVAHPEPGESMRCFATLLLVSLPLTGIMFLMLRHAARLRPSGITLGAGLAVGAIAASAMTLLHRIDASLMVLTWNLGAAVATAAVDAVLGRRLMTWFAGRLEA
jgi:hypothetical protein